VATYVTPYAVIQAAIAKRSRVHRAPMVCLLMQSAVWFDTAYAGLIPCRSEGASGEALQGLSIIRKR